MPFVFSLGNGKIMLRNGDSLKTTNWPLCGIIVKGEVGPSQNVDAVSVKSSAI